MKIKPASRRGQVVVELNREDEMLLASTAAANRVSPRFQLKKILVPIDFLGSTAENVVRHAPCPVLVVREQEHEFVAN